MSLSGERLVQRAQKQSDLLVAADEGRATAVGRGGLDAEEPPHDERRRLPLCGDGRVRFVREQGRSEPIGGVANEDFARLRRLFEPRRHVHGVAEHAELALLVADGPGDGEAGVDPDPQREVATGALGDAFVFTIESTEDRERSPLRARRMVDLVVDRAEYRDHRVADVLLDEAAGRPDLDRDGVPCRAHVPVELFRIETLGERREPRDVREQDRHLLGLALHGGDREKARPAFPAETERHRHLGRAFWTGDRRSPHRSEVTSAGLSTGCRRGVLARPPSR